MGKSHGKFPVVGFGLNLGFGGLHNQGLALGRTYIGTVAAAGTVKGGHLNPELQVFKSLAHGIFGLEGVRLSLDFGLIQQKGSDGGMRADKRALSALNTPVDLPFGKLWGDTAFFVCGGARRERAVLHPDKGADRKLVALMSCHGNLNILYKIGIIVCRLPVILCVPP